MSSHSHDSIQTKSHRNFETREFIAWTLVGILLGTSLAMLLVICIMRADYQILMRAAEKDRKIVAGMAASTATPEFAKAESRLFMKGSTSSLTVSAGQPFTTGDGQPLVSDFRQYYYYGRPSDMPNYLSVREATPKNPDIGPMIIIPKKLTGSATDSIRQIKLGAIRLNIHSADADQCTYSFAN